jgi:hypothetical protein
MTSYRDCLQRDAAFHGFIAAYVLVGLLIATLAGVPLKFVPLSYVLVMVGNLPSMLLLLLAGAVLWSLRSPAPLKALRALVGKLLFTPHAVASLALFASLLLFLGVFSSIKSMLPDVVPFFADRQLADFDQLLHGKDPWKHTAALVPAWMMTVLEWLYFAGWAAILLSSMLAVLLVPKLRKVRTRYIWACLITWPLLGNIVAGATMSAGPIYYGLVTGEARFDELVAYVARHSQLQEVGRAFLWQAYASGQAGMGTGISAFPSMHIAAATLFVLLAAEIHRGLMWVAVAFCAIILFGSVLFGWHYAVDGYFSIAATVLIWKLVGWALKPKPAIRGRRPKPIKSIGYKGAQPDIS